MKNITLKNKRILITGITGFVGTALADRLSKEGAKVYGISSKKQTKNIKKINILQFKKLEDFIVSKKIKICFHLAGESLVESGQSDPYQTFTTNLQGTVNILELARIHKFDKVIVASSSHVYGRNNMLPYKEYFPSKPSRPYETSKACTDLIAQSYADTFHMPVFIARFVNIYGPGDIHFSRLIPKTIKSVIESKNPDMWGGNALRDYLYVSDAIDAYLKLAIKPAELIGRNKIFNFGAQSTHTVRDVIEKIILISGKDVQIKRIEEQRELEIKEQHVSSLKAKRILGWQAKVTLQEGLEKSYKWYIKNLINSA